MKEVSRRWPERNRMQSDLMVSINFLERIGLGVKLQEGVSGFVEGVRIESGILLVDPACRVSGLLHEAGHLACIPTRFRHYMDDNLANGMRRMMSEIRELSLDPDHPLERAAIQCSDPEATAWAWAAGIALGLRFEQIIQDDEYDAGGAGIRMMLIANRYLGINGLAHAGMCKRGYFVDKAECYPKMQCWLQTADV